MGSARIARVSEARDAPGDRSKSIMTVCETSAPTPFRLVAHYDRLRLSIYQERGRRAHAISIRDSGHSTFLRFDDVGYFNTVYSRGDDIDEQFDETAEFFRGSPHGCRLLSPALSDCGPLAEQCRARGWVPDESYAWLSGPCSAPVSRDWGVTIRQARRDEAQTFCRTYLEAFDAAPDRFPVAVDNMQHLFDEPTLHFLLAMHVQRPAGIGMWLQVGEAGLLCAGAMLPAYRRCGGHEALLAARLERAHASGCAEVHSWAQLGGQSHVNLERAGLQTVATTRAWRLLPRHR